MNKTLTTISEDIKCEISGRQENDNFVQFGFERFEHKIKPNFN